MALEVLDDFFLVELVFTAEFIFVRFCGTAFGILRNGNSGGRALLLGLRLSYGSFVFRSAFGGGRFFGSFLFGNGFLSRLGILFTVYFKYNFTHTDKV